MISFISHLISEASYRFTQTDYSDRNLTLMLPMNTDYIGVKKIKPQGQTAQIEI